MSVVQMAIAHDETALTALASAGLLRRARKADVGKIKFSDDSAVVDIGDFRVVLDQKGPGASTCNCPATGVCMHILAAVLALQSSSTDEPDEECGPAQNVVRELCGLANADIEKFAGADWAPALRFVPSIEPDIADKETSVTVKLIDLAPVTFIAGQTLRQAVWKGADSRRRLAVTAAVLLVRQANGLMQEAAPALLETTIDLDLLSEVSDAIETSATAVLTGAAALAADQLLDLAISTRADTAPRLAAELRGLVRQATQADARSPQFEPDRFIAAASRAHALTHALANSPADIALSGQLTRDYQPTAPIKAVTFGARVWGNPSGARGLRIYAFDFENARWLTAGPARGPGMDPAFNPRSAFFGPLLGAATGEKLLGRQIEIASPRIAPDSTLAPDTKGDVFGTVQEIPEFEDDWGQVRTILLKRFGSGLRRSANSVVLLLKPAYIETPRRRSLGDEFVLPLRDQTGAVLELHIDHVDRDSADLKMLREVDSYVLIEANMVEGAPNLSFVSAIWKMSLGLEIWAPPLTQNKIKNAGGFLGKIKSHKAAFEMRRKSDDAKKAGMQGIADEVLRASVDMVTGLKPDPSLQNRVDALGLSSLSQSLREPLSSQAALRTAFLASELAWLTQPLGNFSD